MTIEILDIDANVIGGPYDYSASVESVEITFPEIRANKRINTYCSWEAKVDIGDAYTAFSVDARDTASSPTGASLLALGNRVDLRLDGSRFWPPLYILRTPSPLDLEQSSITLELGDLSHLTNIRQPENDYSAVALGASTAPHTLINEIATSAGIPTSGDTITTGYNISAPAPKNDTRSWPNFIGEIAACNVYVAWLDSTESLRLTPINLDKAAPDVSLLIGRDEVGTDGWVPQNFEERPPGTLKVIGGGGRARQIQNPRIIDKTVEGDGFTSLTSTETRTINDALGAPDTTVEYDERQAELQIRPAIATVDETGVIPVITDLVDNTETALRDSIKRDVTRRYNGITKALTRETIIARSARGLAGGDAYHDTEGAAALTVIETEDTEIIIEYDNATGRIKRITVETKKPYCLFSWGKTQPQFYEINRFLKRTSFKRVTEWNRVLDVSGDPTIEAWEVDQVTQRPRGEVYSDYAGPNPETLINVPDERETFKIRASDGSTEPPETQYQDSLFVRDETQFSGEAGITPLSGNAHKLAEDTIKIDAPVIVSSGQCNKLADFYARWQHGLSQGRSFIGAIPSEFFSAFEPALRFDVTEQNATKAFFLNGFTISGDSEETLFGCNFGEIGVVGITPDIVTPPVTISKPPITSVGGIYLGGFALVGAEDRLAVGGHVLGGVATVERIFTAIGGHLSGGTAEVVNTSSLSAIGGHVLGGTAAVSSALRSVGGHVLGGAADVVGAGQDPDATAFINRLSGTYSQSEQDEIHAAFIALKANGIWAVGDAIWLWASDNSTDANLNFKGTDYTSIPVNMTFIARQGFTGNGSTSYIDSGFNPNAAGGNYSLNSGSVGAYLRINQQEESLAYGARSTSGGDTRTFLYPRRPSPANETLSLLNARTSTISNTVTDSRGLFLTSRTASNLTTSYREAGSLGASTEPPRGLVAEEIYFGGYNNVGGLNFSSSNQFAFGFIGGGLSSAQVTALNTIVNDLLTAFGANV